MDTDSIIYVEDPREGKYNVPTGKMLGQWEEEKESVIGIVRVDCAGPKTYCLELADGTFRIKAKGLSLNYSTNRLLNGKKFQMMTDEFLSGENPAPIKVPQFTFSWSLLQDMQTEYHMKDFRINRKDLKGKLIGNYLYPFGYEPDSL